MKKLKMKSLISGMKELDRITSKDASQLMGGKIGDNIGPSISRGEISVTGRIYF